MLVGPPPSPSPSPEYHIQDSFRRPSAGPFRLFFRRAVSLSSSVNAQISASLRSRSDDCQSPGPRSESRALYAVRYLETARLIFSWLVLSSACVRAQSFSTIRTNINELAPVLMAPYVVQRQVMSAWTALLCTSPGGLGLGPSSLDRFKIVACCAGDVVQ